MTNALDYLFVYFFTCHGHPIKLEHASLLEDNPNKSKNGLQLIPFHFFFFFQEGINKINFDTTTM